MHLKLKSNKFFSYHRGIPLSIISILQQLCKRNLEECFALKYTKPGNMVTYECIEGKPIKHCSSSSNLKTAANAHVNGWLAKRANQISI